MSTVEDEGKQKSASTEAAKARSPLADQGPGNVDKIRDILFGTQMRDYEQRFARLEESLRKESAELRDSTRKRLDALEGYIKKELESLESRLKSEKDERSENHRQLAGELKSTGVSITKKIGEVEDQNSLGSARASQGTPAAVEGLG